MKQKRKRLDTKPNKPGAAEEEQEPSGGSHRKYIV